MEIHLLCKNNSHKVRRQFYLHLVRLFKLHVLYTACAGWYFPLEEQWQWQVQYCSRHIDKDCHRHPPFLYRQELSSYSLGVTACLPQTHQRMQQLEQQNIKHRLYTHTMTTVVVSELGLYNKGMIQLKHTQIMYHHYCLWWQSIELTIYPYSSTCIQQKKYQKY